MRSIAWMAEKGGAGKSTSAVNTAVCLAKQGHRVLFIDADHQGNASSVCLKGNEPSGPTLYHVLTETADTADAIDKTGTKHLDLLPADVRLADANVTLAGEMGRERRLRLAMRDVDDNYEFVIIDTSPQRTLINTNVLNYVGEVFCPVDPGVWSLLGIVKLQGAIADVVRLLDNQALKIAGMELTKARHDNLSRDVENQLRATFGPLVFTTVIPDSIKLGEAHARFESVMDYAARSPGAVAYRELTMEIIDRGKTHRTRDVSGGGSQPDGSARRPGRRDRREAG
jgi:chromosome partitioning protein